jgi:hypothetical protein
MRLLPITAVLPCIAWATITQTASLDPSGSFKLHATLDGAPWSGDTGVDGGAFWHPADSVLLVYGRKAMIDSSEAVRLVIPGFTGPGRYSLRNSKAQQMGGSFEGTAGGMLQSFWRVTNLPADTGTVVVTQFDREARIVRGTFSFTTQPDPRSFSWERDSSGRMFFGTDRDDRSPDVKTAHAISTIEGSFSGPYDSVPHTFRRRLR